MQKGRRIARWSSSEECVGGSRQLLDRQAAFQRVPEWVCIRHVERVVASEQDVILGGLLPQESEGTRVVGHRVEVGKSR